MAIREQFRRAMRLSSTTSGKDVGDEACGDGVNTAKTTASSSQTSLSSKQSSSSLLTRTFTWGSRDKNRDKEKQPRKSSQGKKRPTHPSEKPLTAQNLKHQEMLSQFTWTFGASNPQQIEGDDFSGISPCCTRAPSIVGDSDCNTSTSGTDSEIA